MDIRQAKQQIKNAMLAYFSKDEFGNYRLPTERQRPCLLYTSETPAPKPESKPDAPKPLPSTTDSKQAPANAAALAATGDAPLPQIALGIALLAGGVTLTCAIAMQITRKKRSNRS